MLQESGDSAPIGVSQSPALHNAKPYDLSLTSRDIRVSELARKLYHELLAQKHARSFRRYQPTLINLLLNLLTASLQDSQRFVRYSRDRNTYKLDRYNPLPVHWALLDRAINKLVEAGLIEHHVGKQSYRTPGHGLQSRMRSTPKLLQLFEDHELDKSVISHTPSETIILRWANGRPLDYTDNRDTRRMRRNLETINNMLETTTIELHPVGLERLRKRLGEVGFDYSRNRLVRIFGGRFNTGGRFYRAWWQDIPRELRPYITIGGQQTVEIDYGSLHYCMMYAALGLSSPADAYGLPRLFQHERIAAKLAAQILINTEGRTAALAAIRSEFEKEDIAFPHAYPTPSTLLDALEAQHAPISQFFYSGVGASYQLRDSGMAERIMLNLAGDSIVCLPLHDSFIVQAKHKDWLDQEMRAAYREATGGNEPCGLKVTMGEDPALLDAEY